MSEWSTEAMQAKLNELKATNGNGGSSSSGGSGGSGGSAPAKVTPKIDTDKPRYSQATFLGRMRHFLDVIGSS